MTRARMTDRRRARLRRILLLASLPFALAALLFSGKLLSLSAIAGDGIDAYDAGEYASSAERFDSLLGWNPIEPWVAHFGAGTALAGTADLNPAIVELERALDLAPASKECDVAVNLSLSWELLGDAYTAEGLLSGASRLYETARAVIESVGEDCAPPEAPFNEEEGRDPGAELSDAGDRLEVKLDQNERAQQESGSLPAEQDTQDQLDELEQQNEDAAGEKAQQEGLRGGGGASGGFTDRPW